MNKKRLLVLIGMIFLLTGCVKYDLNMGVGEDKSISITIIDAIQKEYAGSLDNTDSLEEYKNLGYEVETYNDNSYTGLKLTKKFTSIDEISGSDVQTFELTSLLDLETTNYKIFNSNKIGTTTTYKANFTYDLTMDEADNTNSSEQVDYSAYSDNMIFTYKISLPSNAKIITHNADEKSTDGYTLTWNMKYGELKNINFTFSIDDNDVTTNPGNNNDDNTNNDNNGNNNGEQVPPENDNINDDNNDNNTNKDNSNKNDKTNKTNNLGPIIGALLAIVIILGLLVYKIKMKKEDRTPNTPMSHSQAPKR